MIGKKEFIHLLEELMQVEPGTLTGTEELADLQDWGSLTVIEFIALVDERFGLTLSAQHIAACRSIEDLVALLGDQIIS